MYGHTVILWSMLGYVWPAPMPHSRTPRGEASTNAHGWATMNINKSQTSKVKFRMVVVVI